MRYVAILLGAVVLLALIASLVPVAGRKSTVPLISRGKTVAIAKRPSALAWKAGECSVYVGTTNVFSLGQDLFDFPLFIYPFADGERFLCIYDWDTAVLVFVVDFARSSPDAAKPPQWPIDAYVRGVLITGATNVVTKTKGLVRMPICAELQEVSSNLTSLSERQFRSTSFPALDLRVYRGYWPKQALFNAIDTNRQSCWP